MSPVPSMTDLIHHSHQTATLCFNCGKPIHGRADKKFCHSGCKNDYNNRLQRQERAAISDIDLILKHNRRILKEFLGEASTKKIALLTLVQKGFRFEYCTHQYSNY
ncbi:MAG: hypothetical protein Q8927_02415 [Bacteroidota bacterium]|nr:hypothetical protein [Bacteroidota bacterium]MDP4247925.1 hypothetical protein [Bacteroidota bacterium]